MINLSVAFIFQRSKVSKTVCQSDPKYEAVSLKQTDVESVLKQDVVT